jgi:hypothetical protein
MKRKTPKSISERAIDELVIAQADDASAWEPSVHVRRTQGPSVRLPAHLAAQAAFFARLHRDPSLADWLRRVVQERLDLEEATLADLKRRLTGKRGVQRSSV